MGIKFHLTSVAWHCSICFQQHCIYYLAHVKLFICNQFFQWQNNCRSAEKPDFSFAGIKFRDRIKFWWNSLILRHFRWFLIDISISHMKVQFCGYKLSRLTLSMRFHGYGINFAKKVNAIVILLYEAAKITSFEYLRIFRFYFIFLILTVLEIF